MATGDFDLYYPSSPWDGITTNQRTWYDPILREIYVHNTIYNRFVSHQFNLAGVRTTEMNITSLIPPHGNHDPLSLRQLWMPSSFVDTFARRITFERYGAKMAFHKYDDIITYWQQNKAAGLKAIVNKGLGTQMVEIMDKLARDAFFENTFALYGATGNTGTNFSAISSSDSISTELIDDIHLGMAERGVPYASGLNGVQGNIVCVTTPGVIRDLQYEASQGGNSNAFIDIMKYADPQSVMRGEVGTYHHVRFISSPRAILYNCGEVDEQKTVTTAISAGDGSPANTGTVDGVRYVGQTGATAYLQLDSTTGLAVNDIVTIHVDRTSSFGVTNGVDYRDGTLVNRRIVALPGSNRVALDLPIMIDMTTDLGGGVYAYVTKGRHVHTALFLGGSDGVVAGIGQAPQIHTPPPVDDFDSMYRIAVDMYLGYQVFEPQSFEVWYGAGSNRIKGPRVTT